MDLPRGLYRHRGKFRARAWGERLSPNRDGNTKPKWKYFEGPIPEASRAFYQWKGESLGVDGEVAQGLRAYLKSAKFTALSPNTQRTEEPRVKRLIRVFGHMKYHQLEPVDLVGYLETQPPHGGKKDLSRLSAVMTLWVAAGLIQSNFTRAVIKAYCPTDGKRTRYVSDAELVKILEVCQKRFEYSYMAKVVYCHLKMMEICGRRVSTVRDVPRNRIIKDVGIKFTEEKTGKKVIVEWSDALASVIEECKTLLKPGWYLLTNSQGGHVSEGSLAQAYQRMRPHFEKANLEPFQPRDLRAKYGSDMEASGRDGAKNVNNTKKIFDLHYDRLDKKVEPLR